MISETKKIVIGISFVLIFTLAMLVIYEKIVDPSHASDRKREQNLRLSGYTTGEEFFSSDFSNITTVFLIGSSHLGSANVTIINDIVSSNMKNFSESITVYNLAAFGDKPTIRLESIDRIISTSPKIIFYQISYRDFEFIYKDSEDVIPINFDKIIFSKIFSMLIHHVPVNPQELIFSILRPIQNSIAPSFEEAVITNDKTPFYHYTKFDIKSDDELKSELSPVVDWTNSEIKNENYLALRQIIEKTEKNGIKLVIFTSPLHEYYLQALSEKQKNDFSTMLKKIERDYELKIYDLEDEYAGLEVWGNISHISYEKTVTEYNEDIAKIILKELD